MLSDERWIEVTPSAHEHEQAGLELLRKLIPDVDPFHVWTNFEFKDSSGRWHECDALVLGRRRLHLIELKYYSGDLHGDDLRWHRTGHRVEDSPLLLARRKAQRFASKLKDAVREWCRERGQDPTEPLRAVPWVQESVFLHHPGLRSHLTGTAALGIYGLDGHEHHSGLAPISDLVLELPDHREIKHHKFVVGLLQQRLGLVQRREPAAGSWNLQERIAEGDTWEDWLASHQVAHQRSARIRFHSASPGVQSAAEVRRMVENEYAKLATLKHDGLLRPDDLVDSELGLGLVYPADDSERLDLWLAGRNESLSLDQRLGLIRQVAEAVHYAHRNQVAHRGLNPQALWVTSDAEMKAPPKVAIGDWQSAGTATALGTQGAGVTSLYAAHTRPAGDPTAPYRAPEEGWSPTANRIRLDLFGLGATAYYLLTGKAPAPSASALRERLRTQQGLDLAVDLPQAPSDLRALILRATHPSPAQRTGDVGDFLTQLDRVEESLTQTTDHALDPLTARAGDVLDNRFTVERRLGAGSTAVGLQVRDERNPRAKRVLKVALDDSADARLRDEAEVLESLKSLDSPRLVKLVESVTVGKRQALLLSLAGEQTLAEHLAERERLSLDLLERWGTDLLDVLVELDRAGVDHRDIKPSNLGVVKRDGAQHLVLFDFSLSRASAGAITAGTAPYLDPFLGGERDRFDQAAERYAAAVVLFEMATGQVPQYGDGSAHPNTINDEVTLHRGMFDKAVADSFQRFFTRALARDAKARHRSAGEMREAWRRALDRTATTHADSGDELADKVTLTTPLTRSGLSARALSLLEPLRLKTVGDLTAVHPIRFRQLSGANSTRDEVVDRARQWRTRLGSGTLSATESSVLPSLADIAHTLIRSAGGGRSRSRSQVLHMLLGEDPAIDPFVTHAVLAEAVSLTGPRVSQIINDLHDAWAEGPALELLNQLDTFVLARVRELGGVATLHELADALIAAMPAEAPADPAAGEHTDIMMEASRPLARGVLRLLHDRQRRLAALDQEELVLDWRRRRGVMHLAALDPALLDLAEALGARADQLVREAGAPSEALVPADRAYAELAALISAEARRVTFPEEAEGRLEGTRLPVLAAGCSTSAVASALGDLHTRELARARALELALGSVAPSQRLSSKELVDRVAARFPALPRLPLGDLDEIVAASGLDLEWNAEKRTWGSRPLTDKETGLGTRRETELPVDLAPLSVNGVVGQRLADSRKSRSFLVLGVPADQHQRLVTVLTAQHAARAVNVTALFLERLRAANNQLRKPIDWAEIQRADAALPDTREATGLRNLAGRACEATLDEIDAIVADVEAAGPVVLIDAEPLTRYGHAGGFTRWSDLGRSRANAVWLVVPQLATAQGPLLDGRPVQASPNQFVPVDRAWLSARWAELAGWAKRGVV
ncbi:BREX system serine/threonine kinase PglW [Granulicoccus sp. GXG6511]|uniref:BREX system serine/threonine kinase PglW n=1 Tax=Granulicoccus sp. GXG6511 TaxID=3381351 RepID=UPI003D7C99EC